MEALADRAEERRIEIVPKLNFAQSALHRHNHWFRPHNDLFDSEEYWRLAFEIIDELIAVARPKRFFHIGMDEDHHRSYPQYVRAIQTLHDGLAERSLRPIIWNDSACMWPQAEIHREKSEAAEKAVSCDVVQVLWDYRTTRREILERLLGRGFTVWGAPGRKPDLMKEARDILVECGADGVLFTRWKPWDAASRQDILDWIQSVGAVLHEP